MGRRELNLKHAILKASVTHTGGDVPVTAGYSILELRGELSYKDTLGNQEYFSGS